MATPEPQRQRNALVPGLLASIALFLSPLPLFQADLGRTIILYIVAILALIVAWFAWQAKQWWWTIVFVVIAVVWNPVYPIEITAPWAWIVAAIVSAVAFISAAALVTNERAAE